MFFYAERVLLQYSAIIAQDLELGVDFVLPISHIKLTMACFFFETRIAYKLK